ncbi:MAG: 6-carboxytetrahydropterin synthase [Thermoguttaceae bacterium]|jgi:6-pyruvoyltetrahydropterin/6-carboxytetrahydropterin synthase
MPTFHVRIAGDDLGFSAAHFLAFTDGRCEPLHGHNYRVAAEVSGPLDENQCVVDFVVLAERLRAVLAQLDHAVLLPAEHPALRVTVGQAEVEVLLGPRRWLLPRADCRVLPLTATTAELLAEHVGHRLWEDVRSRTGWQPERLRVEIEETPGRWAAWEGVGLGIGD